MILHHHCRRTDVYLLATVSFLAFLAAGFFYFHYHSQYQPTGPAASLPAAPAPVRTAAPADSVTPVQSATSPTPQIAAPEIVPPISRAAERVTKKPFGIKVSPGRSPVSPERFSGYHTGTDFETFPEEQNIDVPIMAICSGRLLKKAYGSGYGGYAVESCNIKGQDVTVVYGHLRLSSITADPGESLTAGQQIAVLGTGYGTETDGERKHLHLGIHIGKTINTSGYVAATQQSTGWIDYQSLI